MAGVRFLAIVPARGGSKGLPGKNIRPFAGQPLIVHSISAAQGCPLIERCVVSTDDPNIATVARSHGAEVIARPPELATDTARTHDAVRHVLQMLDTVGELPEYVVLLQPTSPLRTADHLTACLEAFLASGAASAISVTMADSHPFKDFLVRDGYLVPLFGEEGLEQPRQLLPTVLKQNGAIYVVGARRFLDTNTFYIPPALPFVMTARTSVDIDTALDFAFAEAIATGAA